MEKKQECIQAKGSENFYFILFYLFIFFILPILFYF